MKQTITFTVKVDVDAETAAKLPGYLGTGNPATSYGDVDIPVSGLDIECSLITIELARKVQELLPARLGTSVWWHDFEVSRPKPVKAEVF